jgi:hypothetical protein
MFTTLRIATITLLVGLAGAAAAQTTNPPAPPADQAPAAPQQQAPQQQATTNYPALQLGRDDVREVQNQLIALGFDPGPADGVIGPGTQAAAQQYDQNRGGSGQVAIDSEFLARLKADTAPRLSYDQVIARSRSYSQARAAAPANQLGGVIQQLAPLIGAAINSGNYGGGYGGYYGYGGYPGPGYYGPAPVYGGYGYGGYGYPPPGGGGGCPGPGYGAYSGC